jgi:DNA-binding protein HU-beta
MNRRELVRAVAAQTTRDVKEVEQVVAGLTDVITAVVAKGEAVSIQGFAKFTKISRKARMGRNPQTGEPVKIKAKTVAKATAMKAFRDTVMTPSKAPRLARGVWPTSPDLLAAQARERKEALAANDGRSTRAGATTRSGAAKRAGTVAKKTVAKRAPAKRAPAQRATTRRAVAKKAPAAKAVARKATARQAAKKAPARKAVAKRVTARKAAGSR